MQRFILLILGAIFSIIIQISGDKEAAAKETIRLTTCEFPPFRMTVGKELTGSDVELVTHVFSRMGYGTEIISLPCKRAIVMASDGTYDGFFTFTKNDEREAKFIFTDPISTIEDVFFKRKKDKINWNTLKDLTAYRIGYTDGYNYDVSFMNAIKSGTLKLDPYVGNNPEETHLKKLIYGNTDLIICEKSLCGYLLKSVFKDAQIDYIPKPIGPIRNFYLGISNKSPNADLIVKRFNKELAKMDDEGRREKIFQRYGMNVKFPTK